MFGYNKQSCVFKEYLMTWVHSKYYKNNCMNKGEVKWGKYQMLFTYEINFTNYI